MCSASLFSDQPVIIVIWPCLPYSASSIFLLCFISGDWDGNRHYLVSRLLAIPANDSRKRRKAFSKPQKSI